MPIGTEKRKKRNSPKVNLVISLVFHGAIMGVLLYFAAREGLLGKQIKKIAVEMVKEKPPEKPKEPEKPKVAKIDVPKVEAPKVVETAKIEPPKETAVAPPPASVAPAVAPPAAELPAFAFEGGKAVVSSSDPIQLYKGLLESSLRFNWDRPKGEDDHTYMAEIEVAVDSKGDISDPVWKKSSGHKKWDESVRASIMSTAKVSRPPPKNFPARVVVRFDVEPLKPVAALQ
ncbi:MAG TPA: TonB C-terminal domain-containing protein [Verrucomicrobiae bacterium]|jgi:outer membrane biosynthesis protein TonB